MKRPAYATAPLIVASALFMENLDASILSTALPAIAADLRVDPLSLKLALTAYLAALAIFIPISGWAADRFGARAIFRGAIAVFTLGSVLCGLSQDLPQLVGARFLQGAGGALMVPVGRLVVFRSVSRADMVKALAWLTTPALIGPVLGPPIGGAIATYWHWRWIFWINAPIGILGIALATRFLPDAREPAPGPLDWRGFALSGAGLSLTIFGVTVAGRGAISTLANVAMIGSGLALLALYVRHASRAPFPLLDLRLFEKRTFRASVTGGFLFRIGMGAMPFLLPLGLQYGFGWTPLQSGLVTFASALGALAMKPTAPAILKRFGFRKVLIANALLSAFGLALYAAFTANTPAAVIIATLLVAGFFRSLEFTAINAIGYAEIDPPMMSKATSLAAVCQQLSLSAGVGIGAGVLEMERWRHNGVGLTHHDFVVAILTVSAISACAAFVFARLPANAGADISGREPGPSKK